MKIDFVIPVYNESENIIPVLQSFKQHLTFQYSVLICYDRDDDTTLPALKASEISGLPIQLVKNEGRGVIGAILTGMKKADGDGVLTFPADDDYNANRLNSMVEKLKEGNDIVCGSRFMKGGDMRNCPLLKAILVRTAAWILYHICGLPTRDGTNGLRLFSRRVINQIPIESTMGFAFSLELLAKAHRLGWPIAEIPFSWVERKAGKSRFKILKWIPQYTRWLLYSFCTNWLGHKHVQLKD